MAIIRPVFNWVAQPGITPSAVTFTRGTTATYTDACGVLRTAPAGVLRDSYDPATGAYLGKLIEEGRTRLNHASAAPTAPESLAVAAQAYTVSFHGTGSVTLSGAAVGVVAGAGAYPARAAYAFTPAAGTLTMTPAGQVLDLQLEAGTFATSVMRGEGAQQTRAADACTLALSGLTDHEGNALFSPTAGTLYVQFAFSGLRTDSSGQAALGLDDGTGGNRVAINRTQGNGVIATVKSGGLTVGASQVLTVTPSVGTAYRAALAFDATGRSACLNGGAVASDATPLSLPLTTLNFGSLADSVFLGGVVRQAALFNRRLSGADLQALTA